MCDSTTPYYTESVNKFCILNHNILYTHGNSNNPILYDQTYHEPDIWKGTSQNPIFLSVHFVTSQLSSFDSTHDMKFISKCLEHVRRSSLFWHTQSLPCVFAVLTHQAEEEYVRLSSRLAVTSKFCIYVLCESYVSVLISHIFLRCIVRFMIFYRTLNISKPICKRI